MNSTPNSQHPQLVWTHHTQQKFLLESEQAFCTPFQTVFHSDFYYHFHSYSWVELQTSRRFKGLFFWRINTIFQKVPKPREWTNLIKIARPLDQKFKAKQFCFNFLRVQPGTSLVLESPWFNCGRIETIIYYKIWRLPHKNHNHVPKTKMGEKQNKLILKARVLYYFNQNSNCWNFPLIK